MPTAMGTCVQLLHQCGPIKHKRLNPKKQTLADLESISYVLIVNDSKFQSKRISHENSMVLELPFHLKMSPSPEMQPFPI